MGFWCLHNALKYLCLPIIESLSLSLPLVSAINAPTVPILELYTITQFIISLTQILYDMEKEVQRRQNGSGINM